MLYVHETHVNRDENYLLGEPDESETRYEETGELYRALRSEYGRCIGKVYIGDDAPRAIGWVFVKRERYEDDAATFLHETWVSVMDAPTKVTVIREPSYVTVAARRSRTSMARASVCARSRRSDPSGGSAARSWRPSASPAAAGSEKSGGPRASQR